MNITPLEQSVIKYIQQLNPDEQKQVLEFARSLTGEELSGVTGQSLLAFSGVIEKDDLKLMKEAIDRDCEKVSQDEW